MCVQFDVAHSAGRCTVRGVQQGPTEVFHYDLVDDEGEPIGDLAHESDALDVGDIIPFDGHVYEIRDIDEAVLHVRRVI